MLERRISVPRNLYGAQGGVDKRTSKPSDAMPAPNNAYGLVMVPSGKLLLFRSVLSSNTVMKEIGHFTRS